MFKLIFQHENGGKVTAAAEAGEDLLSVAVRVGVQIDAPCAGSGTCGKCKLRLLSGAVDTIKNTHLSEEDFASGWRLACQSFVMSDATLLVPSGAAAYKNDIRIADLNDKTEIAIYEKTVVDIFTTGIFPGTGHSVVTVQMQPPSLADSTADKERLVEALREQVGDSLHISIDRTALFELPSALREGDFKVHCLIRELNDRIRILNVQEASKPMRVFGVAIDVGTTTVSATLVDLFSGLIYAKAGCGNDQIRYGADVINRIIRSTRPGGGEALRRAVMDNTIRPLLKTLCGQCGADPNNVVRAVISGNTTMNHLLLGLPANSIRLEPYVPVFCELSGLTAAEIGMDIHPEADVVFAPNVGSYVGGDITAGTLASMIWDHDELSLMIDLGTNGELVLGNRDFLVCCACSAGPAFEGGDISCGMRATTGAIQGCVIDKETMEPQLEIIGEAGTKAMGICGSGLIDAISELFRCGIINAKGKIIRDGRRIIRDDYGAAYVLSFADESASGHRVELNEVDIDNFIRAKGSIFSAVRAMLNAIDMDVSAIDKVIIAGGIGKGIDIKKAITIGMLPDLPLERYEYIGNSSLLGAYSMLMSVQAEAKVTMLRRNMTYLELSSHPGYMDEFVAACFLPHTDASLFPGTSLQ